jgi:hypothetical protein
MLPLRSFGPMHHHVGFGKSGIEQSLRHRLRRLGGTSDRIRGIDFDQLLENVVRHRRVAASLCAAAAHACAHRKQTRAIDRIQ